MGHHLSSLPSRRSGRPSREVASQLPSMLLDAAQTLFLARGYGATTVAQIAARIGATKRTVYAKFGDKAGLFAAMTKRLLDRHRGWINDEIPGATVEDRLHNFCSRLLAQMSEPDMVALYRVMVAETHRFPELARLVNRLATTGVHRRLARILADEAAAGSLQVENSELAAELLVGMILHAAVRGSMLSRRTVAHDDPALCVRTAVALFLDGCRRSPRPRAARTRRLRADRRRR
jgi:TetR/AcrR family transcriptional regulator, mexJK operon transcriptional repressor